MARRASLRGGTIAFIAAFMFVACSPASSASPSAGGSAVPPASGQPAASGTPPSGSVSTENLVIAVGGLGKQEWLPWVPDSSTASIKNHIGEALIRVNRQTRVKEPWLAESWTQSADGRTLDIKLRADVPFHDGLGNVTAEDVKFTIEQYIGPDAIMASQQRALAAAVDNDPAKNVQVVGPLELRITSPKFVVGLLPALADGDVADAMYIQSKKYWTEKPEDAKLHPIGTGPYTFVSSTPGVDVKLKALDTHWRKTATFKNVTFSIIPDAAARLAQLEGGAVDVAAIPSTLVREALAKNIKIMGATDYAQMSVMLGGQYPGAEYDDPTSPWVQRNAPEKGVAIRQALSLAIDRKAILDAVMAGQGTLTTAPISQYPKIENRNLPNWTVPAYDPDLAKQKLAEGGYPDGFTITVQFFENRPGSGQRDIAEAVAGMWEAIGLKVEREQLDDTQSDEYIREPPKTQGKAWIRLESYNDEPVQNLISRYHPGATLELIHDPLITESIPLMDAEIDPVKRSKYNTDILQKMIDNMSIIPMFTVNWPAAVGPKVNQWDKLTGSGYITDVETMAP